MQEINDQKNNKRTKRALIVFAGVCLMLTLTGCEGSSNDLTLKETEETQQTEYISDPETENETEIETEALDPDTEDPVYQVITDASNLNVRENPDADSDIIAKLSNGEIVTGTGETSGDWVQVYYPSNNTDENNTGWASVNYLRAVTEQNPETESGEQVVKKRAGKNQSEEEQEANEIIAEAAPSQAEEQSPQTQKEITIENYINWVREIVQALDAGDLASASELSGSEISEEDAETMRWAFELMLQWMEKGYIVLDESGTITFTDAGKQAAEDELAQEMYARMDQQEQTEQYQDVAQAQEEPEAYQDDAVQVQEEEPVEAEQIQEEESVQEEVLPQICGNCGGSGLVTVDTRTVCPICGGSGMQYIPNAIYDTIMGWQGTYVSCSGCGGSGYTGSVFYDTCSVCGGNGYF